MRYDSARTYSYAQIRAITDGVVEQHFRNDSEIARAAPYKWFLPIFRLGLIEFVGNGRYGISPTVLLRMGDKLALVNGTEKMIAQISSTFSDASIDHFGVLRFSSSPLEANEFAKELDIEVSTPNILAWLRQIPRVFDIPNTWGKEQGELPKVAQVYKERDGWVSKREANIGIIFRSIPNGGSQKYLINHENECIRIPTTQTNPDAFNVALCVSRVIQGRPTGIHFERNLGTIEFRSGSIPILLERLLRIHNMTYYENGEIETCDGNSRFMASPEIQFEIKRILS